MYNMNKADILEAAEDYADLISFSSVLGSTRKQIMDAYIAGAEFARGKVLDD